MGKFDEDGRFAAAAGMLIFHGAACAGGGRWTVMPVAALLAWGLLKKNRAVWAIVFGFSAFAGSFGALGLACYALRVSGVIGPARAPVETVWVVYFACVVTYFLALAVLLAPWKIAPERSQPRLSA